MASFIYKKCMECIGMAHGSVRFLHGHVVVVTWPDDFQGCFWINWIYALPLVRFAELSATWYMRVLSHASISHILHLFAVILHCTNVKWELDRRRFRDAIKLACLHKVQHTTANIKVKIFFVLSHSIHY